MFAKAALKKKVEKKPEVKAEETSPGKENRENEEKEEEEQEEEQSKRKRGPSKQSKLESQPKRKRIQVNKPKNCNYRSCSLCISFFSSSSSSVLLPLAKLT